ncbi:MAG TPA: hypothetical protein VGX16_05285 [Solirubrobacteraceae bacterium]|nr:hypothetical protein [Solirubrobacteraceae bacterium]
MRYEREIIKPLAEGVRVRFRYQRGFAPYYSVTMEIRRGGAWRTVRSWDNAHDRHEHHLHRYTKARAAVRIPSSWPTRQFRSP